MPLCIRRVERHAKSDAPGMIDPKSATGCLPGADSQNLRYISKKSIAAAATTHVRAPVYAKCPSLQCASSFSPVGATVFKTENRVRSEKTLQTCHLKRAFIRSDLWDFKTL